MPLPDSFEICDFKKVLCTRTLIEFGVGNVGSDINSLCSVNKYKHDGAHILGLR